MAQIAIGRLQKFINDRLHREWFWERIRLDLKGHSSRLCQLREARVQINQEGNDDLGVIRNVSIRKNIFDSIDHDMSQQSASRLIDHEKTA